MTEPAAAVPATVAEAAAAAPPRESPWKGTDFALPIFILLPACDFASIYGSQAEHLEVPGAGLVQMSPAFILGTMVFGPLLLFQTKWARVRHAVTLGLVFFWMMSPFLLLAATCTSIRLSRMPSYEEVQNLRRQFPFPTQFTSSSREGDCLIIRRSNDSPELRRHLQDLGVLGTTTKP